MPTAGLGLPSRAGRWWWEEAASHRHPGRHSRPWLNRPGRLSKTGLREAGTPEQAQTLQRFHGWRFIVYIHNPARIHPFPDSHPACCAATLQYDIDRASRRPGTFPNPCAPQLLVSMGPSWGLEYPRVRTPVDGLWHPKAIFYVTSRGIKPPILQSTRFCWRADGSQRAASAFFKEHLHMIGRSSRQGSPALFARASTCAYTVASNDAAVVRYCAHTV